MSKDTTRRAALLAEQRDLERLETRAKIDPVVAKIRRVLLAQALGEDIRLEIRARDDVRMRQANDRMGEDA